MLPRYHIIIGLIISSSIVLLFNISLISGIIIFLSSFLIDIDHYFYYIYKKKNLSIKKSYQWFVKRTIKCKKIPKKQRKNYKSPVLIFHGIEFWLFIFILSLFYHFFFYIFIGIIIHMFVDISYIIYQRYPCTSKISQINTYLKNKNKKQLIR